MLSILEKFHPIVRSWFVTTFGEPSPPQKLGWPSISSGNHTLIVAPTGSGKTLAAFLWCINHLVEENLALCGAIANDEVRRQSNNSKRGKLRLDKNEIRSDNPFGGIRILYVSPLKALNNDIHRNLEIPLQGILNEAQIQGRAIVPIRSAVRTGDTTQAERNNMLKNPPDILITTPESLYLMLSSEKARKIFHTVRYVIVDEIHAISNNKRGVHLSITLERLEELVRKSRELSGDDKNTFVRIGLSATQKPLEEVAKYLGGMNWTDQALIPRPVTIVDAGYKKNIDLKVICAPRDFANMVSDSAWNSIYPELLKEIFAHKTILIFVNNRRLAERLSARLNEMLEGDTNTLALYSVPVFTEKNIKKLTAVPFKVFSYHGSMSRTVREQLESDLKSGKLRVLVSTSALELGIDIGSVDLVIQVQSPKGIARGLQRVGRSGHLVSAESKGRIFVTHREDLIEAAVVAKAMQEHDIEKTFIPKNCLDVLAQHIVAMVGVDEWNIEELYDLVRRSYCYSTLTESVFHSVLEMVSGRYTNETFRELRARIVWNKLHNSLTALPGSSTIALMNAGTIPDRGYYGVYLEDLKTKVGEVDEEFIYESRTGDTFILGTSVWRMVDIDANRVVVQPAPGHPARMPFWRGEMIGRTYELAMKLGEFTERLSNQLHSSSTNAYHRQNDVIQYLNTFPVDEHSILNIIDYIEEQKEATHLVPSHKTIVVEGFRDEIGDPRIVVHSRFGKGINGLLGLVIHYHLQQQLGIEIQMLYNDDGILFRCSDVERLPLDILSTLDFSSAQQTVIELLPSSPLFGALFRQNAERALLLPKGSPGKRRPFFLQRLKAADLLQIVKQYSDFPIVIETIRECLNDVLDFEHFKEVLSQIETGEIQVYSVQTEIPSPFALSLLFDFTMIYMYEWDNPKEAGKEQFAQLNRELLSEVVQLDSVKTVLRNEAVVKVEEQLQFTAITRKARTASELMEIFLRLGDLTDQELFVRSGKNEFVQGLIEKNIIVLISIANSKRYILAEEIPLYLSIAKTEEKQILISTGTTTTKAFERKEALKYLVLRMLHSHGPLTIDEITLRYGVERQECEQLLSTIKKSENLIHGTFIGEMNEKQWCYRPNLERIHRASINILRKEIKPGTLADFSQLLMHWQHRHSTTLEEGEDGIRRVMQKMLGYVLPSELWESEIFKTRLRFYESVTLRSLVSRGEFFCIGTPTGKSQWIERGEGNFFLPTLADAMKEISPSAEKVYNYLKEHGASFLSEIRESINISLNALNRSVAELFWMGIVTNDVVDEVLHVKHFRVSESELPDDRIEIVNPRRNPLSKIAVRNVRTALKNVPGWHGRWSLVHTRSILGIKVSDEEIIQRQAQQLLLRYGIVAREVAKREVNLLPWSMLGLQFQRMEMKGEIRRGYFIEGLSGMQFALPEAVSMLESIKTQQRTDEELIVLNACDPANPYGIGIELLKENFSADFIPRISRYPSNHIIFYKGLPIIWIENFGARMYLNTMLTKDTLRNGLLQYINYVRTTYTTKNEIVVEYCNTLRPLESEAAELLRSIGFYRDKIQTIRLDLR